MQRTRLFFALIPDTAALNSLRAVAASLEHGALSQQVPFANYHVTLAFVGDVARDALASIRQIGATQAPSRGAICLNSCEYWPQASVVVAAGHAAAGLENLAARLKWPSHRTAMKKRRGRPSGRMSRLREKFCKPLCCQQCRQFLGKRARSR